MNNYIISSNATFEAESIDDAFEKLSKYFHQVYVDGLNTNSIFTEGSIEINRVE